MLFDQDNWQEIVNAVKGNRLRSFLTAFGVFWGIFMLIIMLASGNGLQNGVLKEFNSLAVNSVFLWGRTTTIPHHGFPRGRDVRLNTADIHALRAGIPEIDRLAPRNQLGGFRSSVKVIRNNRDGSFNIYGDYPDIAYIQLMDIIRGRFLNRLDIEEKRKVAVIGKRVYKVLFQPRENPIGQYIKIRGIYFKVVGVFKTKNTGDEAEEETQTVFVPFTTFQQAFNYGDRVGWFSFTPVAGVRAIDLEEKITRILAARHHVASGDKHAFGRWNAGKEYNKLMGLFKGIRFLFWFVGISTLLAGVIGVSNIMLVVVKERTREIGIKRAIGATPLHVVAQIMMEAVLLTGLAGYTGFMAGVIIIEAVASLLVRFGSKSAMFQDPYVDFSVAMAALFILIVSGALAGLMPAKRAVEIKPVEAINPYL